ncbi:MAG: hypothetical protein Q8T09_11370 [Candidatus Melainabacteria bacterium]|nr:hypothetical protein [Candidatus Melainabacteria bacterium]
MSTQMGSKPDVLSLNLADSIANQALGFSHTLAQLCLRPHKPDAVTELRRAMSLLPVNQEKVETALEPAPETYDIKLGKKDAFELGSLQLSNEEALALCYRLRVELGSFRPLGAEIIHSAMHTRAQVESTMKQILLIDWSTQAWNSLLMQTVSRYYTFVLSISRFSSAFSEADEDKSEKFKLLIQEELVPECHKIASSLIRTYLPMVFTTKESLLADGSENLKELDRLLKVAQMPLFNFCLFKAFKTLPMQTRDLLADKEDLSDVRDALPQIFTSYVDGLKSQGHKNFEMSESSHYSPDNYLVVPEFAALVDFLKESGEFTGLDLLILLNYTEVVLTVSLLKIDLIEQVLDSGEKQLAGSLSQFYSALTSACSKLSFSNSQLVNELRQQ